MNSKENDNAASVDPVVRPTVTVIDIDHRVWKDWHDESDPDSVISHLNKLLKPHGVRLRKTSEPFDDWLGLEARSSRPNWRH